MQVVQEGGFLRMNKILILIAAISLVLSGCDLVTTVIEDCEMKYDVDDCNLPKCMYEVSERSNPNYRALLLNNYYECMGVLGNG